MISVIPNKDRYFADHGWLVTRWHFSFGDYFDPNNVSFGPLRVFNDDVVLGGGKFDLHPHRDMEIITFVLEGQLRHQDHLGNEGIVHPGEVQVMSAGTGIRHAEGNVSATDPVHLFQIWILPRNKGNQPRWEQKQFAPDERKGRLLPVVSSGNVPGTLAIDQDATIYVSSLASGQAVTHTTAAGRRAYVFVSSGTVDLNGTVLNAGDQAKLTDETAIKLAADADAEVMLIDLP